MLIGVSQLAALAMADAFVIGGIAVAFLAALVVSLVLFPYATQWIQAYMSGADVSVMSLIGMSFRQVKPSMIVTAKIMGRQAGLNINRQLGMSTARLDAHFVARGMSCTSSVRSSPLIALKKRRHSVLSMPEGVR